MPLLAFLVIILKKGKGDEKLVVIGDEKENGMTYLDESDKRGSFLQFGEGKHLLFIVGEVLTVHPKDWRLQNKYIRKSTFLWPFLHSVFHIFEDLKVEVSDGFDV